MAERKIIETPIDWYFTFGFGHLHPNGYIIIEDSLEGEARKWVNSMIGSKWAFNYPAGPEMDKMIERFKMELIKTFHRSEMPTDFYYHPEQTA